MEIQNLSRMDDGLYRCASVVKGRSMTADFMLNISQVGKITHLSLHGDSYPSPTISWMSSSGGKLGIWTVEYTSGQFTVTSTIFPTLQSHINEYKALARNSEGSVEIIIILNVYEPDVIVDSMVPCNTSNDISLTCSINNTDTKLWQNSWKHYRNYVFIRSYSGPDSSWVSVWKIRYCDYQDAGEYVCSWTYNQTEVTASSVVVVYGRQIISKTEMTVERQTWILSVFFFTSSLPFEVEWYINDTHIQQNNSSTIKIANVSLICYEKNISTAGYRSDFLLTNSNGRHLKMNCHIKNKYDSVEGSFENIWSPMGNLIGSTDMDFTETIVSIVSIDRQPEGNYITVKDLYIYISISSATSLIIALSVAMIMIRIRLRRKGKLDMNVNAEREHARENNPPLEIQNDSQYEEIDDRSYNSVTWRNYDLNATSSLDESTDASDRNSHFEIYNSIPNVNVDLENSQTESHHYQSTTVYEIPTNITSGNSPVKFEVIK
ncbi:NCAM [Mytilus coruscus]|uniref:NCAM n=1 Tax=Mytilus coruscus TaxID=42192 RepID=A0A6J8EJF6_MYTCO|nr:NCAM [Mytilus coruscus]